MIPSLFTYTLLAALVLLLGGISLLAVPGKLEPCLRAFPRHRLTGIITMIIGGGWFIWKISQLGQSDFGDYKVIMMLLFGATLLGSIFYVRDFLAVRGVAIIILLAANTGLKSAFGLYDIPERLVLVTILYLFIVLSLVYGTLPYKMRDTMNWLLISRSRLRSLGIILSILGSSLVVSAFLY
ncbi:hypothetical protein G0Q06_10865 [Puniceicoccales bacterium CK1056]|uniref:Uncharacterized protein n=1 Tax=Oceanipulchritudo coccoides TaxID=2706888 RepID=A0A6B2M4C2_9BACT|nr:hypothetical protein [Oceanipulchritudo coccoides]NDV62954.1 hypothetical protein [Oceanipulchritudo coccoides]